MPLLTILTGCFNEEGNVREVDEPVEAVMTRGGDADPAGLRCERMFIDDASKDETVEMPRELAAADKRVKVIATTRNAGCVRLRAHALLHPACRDAPPTAFGTAYHRRGQEATEAA